VGGLDRPGVGTGAARATERLASLERALEAAAASGELRVPPYPAVVLRVQEVMARKGFGLGEVAGLIGADGVLAADVLRCANSVIYRRGAPVIDLTQALTRIGAQQATRLLLATGLSKAAQAVGPLVILRRMAWIEGIASAAVCQTLARLRQLRAEEAFTLGLLHDFGKVVALSGLEALLEGGLMNSAQAGQIDRADWEALVERHHQKVGAILADRWRLPRLVSEVIALHHGAAGVCSDQALLDVVRLSDEVVRLVLAKARVTEEDLVGLGGLTQAERDAIGRVVEQVPDLVVALETASAPGLDPVPSLRLPDTTLSGQRRPARLPVAVMVAKKPRLYTAEVMEPSGIELVGVEPLPVNRLLEAELRGRRHLTVWLLTTLCRSEGEVYRVEAKPFALSGPSREIWNQMMEEQGVAAE
jgi:HD-like signal output (HDOD) protein